MESEIKILNAEKKERSIEIKWSDGNISDYNFLWLRDNCPSEIHPTARERTFNLLTVSESIHPKSFTISEDNSLSIKWSEGDHSSDYSYEWLRKNCYTLKNSTPNHDGISYGSNCFNDWCKRSRPASFKSNCKSIFYYGSFKWFGYSSSFSNYF